MLKKIKEYIDGVFLTSGTAIYQDESGVLHDSKTNIKRLAYSVNLTLPIIEKAKEMKVDLIISHHQAWEELYGLKEACIDKLGEYKISHYYNHLALDDCEFGTNDSFLKLLDVNLIEKTNEWQGLKFGRIAEFKNEMVIYDLEKLLNSFLSKSVEVYKFNNKNIKRLGLICGNGAPTECMKEFYDKGCDLYITGEKSLSTVQYAEFRNSNLIICDHSAMEIFGVEELAKKVARKFDLELIQIKE